MRAKHFILPLGANVLNPDQYICTVTTGRVMRAELTFAQCKGHLINPSLASRFGRNLQGCRIVNANDNLIKSISSRICPAEARDHFVLELAVTFHKGVNAFRTVTAALAMVKQRTALVMKALTALGWQ